MTEQLSLLDGLALRTRRRPTIEERWAEFDAAHPEVYAEVRRLALEAVRAGRKRLGIGELWEVARWHVRTKARDGEGYELNNTWRAVVARWLMAREPELAEAFETRARRAA